MISGIVKGRHATIGVVFRLPNRPNFSIDFVIDTGFTDHLSLPFQIKICSNNVEPDYYINLTTCLKRRLRASL
jgi:predicted aspartyl protease